LTDAADRLAQALRGLINEAVQAAVDPPLPTSVDSLTHRAQEPQPPDPVDEQTRRDDEERFGERAPKTWGERRLVPVAEARQALGGISPATFYKLVQSGELRLVKIGRRSFVLMSTIDEFIERHRGRLGGSAMSLCGLGITRCQSRLPSPFSGTRPANSAASCSMSQSAVLIA
jgi:predicted DNA-binding transcriptional regulator AlpA